jgi:single-stranded-DNA-specific exonuclease
MKILRRSIDPRAEHALLQSGITPLLARLYAARGVKQASELDESLGGLLPPSTLTNADKAATLLADAIAANKRLLIIADYDCDGATACAVALRGLRMFDANVDYLVPNRFTFGYGLTPGIVEMAAQQLPKPDILITVDNGIASVEGVARATELGMQVLITDHHLPGPALPDAAVIVNPNQPGCAFESKAMAGCGVMFYVLLMLRAELRARGAFTHAQEPRLDTLLDLVALGTVADVVPLDANNRRLVAQGLKRLRLGHTQLGIRSLAYISGRIKNGDLRSMTTADFGFALGPRINAAGRLSDMTLGIECLSTDDEARATSLAQQLDSINRERRAVQSDMNEEAFAIVNRMQNDATDSMAAIALFEPHWHEGVLGIVAGKIKDKLHRPTFAFAPGQDGNLKGSGRSIPGFHLRDALDLVAKREQGVLIRFGGHAMAAGGTIAADSFARFQAAFAQVASEWLSPALLARTTLTDGALAVEDWTLATARELSMPVWGQGFAPPLFDAQVEVISQRLLGTAHSGFKLRVNDIVRDAVWWGHTEPLPTLCRVAYRLETNEWNGAVSLRMGIEAVES